MSTAPRIDELRKKFEENPRRYFAPLANELRKAGDLSQAIALCREHLPKQPGHMSGHIVFGQALFEFGELGEARSVFEQALALDPENLIALRHLGDIARRMGDASAARRWYERVLEADPRNDDIAAQLATLSMYATPPIAAAAVVTPPSPAPGIEADAEPTPVAEPADAPLDLAMLDALPALSPLQPAAAVTPSAPMDSIVETGLDLAAIEASVSEVPSIAVEAAEATGSSVVDAFAWRTPGESPDAAVAAAESEAEAAAELAFEEGLVAETWPDTTELVSRVITPRSATPVATPAIDVAVVEAFGREAMDEVDAVSMEPAPDVEPELVPAVEAAHLFEHAAEEPETAAGELAFEERVDTLGIQVGHSILDFEETVERLESPLTADLPDSLVEATEPVEEPIEAPVDGPIEEPIEEPIQDPLEEAIAAPVADLPWLAAPVTPTEEVGEIVEAIAEDARATGEPDDVAVVAMPEPFAIAGAEVEEVSFADVFADDLAEANDAGRSAETATAAFAAPASDSPADTFVTETMGELLVSQGFIGRAIGVYEELVRRRPADPVPLGRLAELRGMQAQQEAVSSAVGVAGRNARAWFAALAARRVARRTPPASVAVPPTSTPAVPMPAVTSPVTATPAASVLVTPLGSIPAEESLASLFGTAATVASDGEAAQFAAAFSGATVEGATESLFSSGAMAAVREPTPVAPIAAESASASVGDAGFSFDRFFPDPAAASASEASPDPSTSAEGKTADDLAQFSAWLKGLGNP